MNRQVQEFLTCADVGELHQAMGHLKGIRESDIRALDAKTKDLFLAKRVLLHVKVGTKLNLDTFDLNLKDPEAKIILEYAHFSYLFWTDQVRAEAKAWSLLLLSLRRPRGCFIITALFLIGHMNALLKKSLWGYLLAKLCFDLAVILRRLGLAIPSAAESIVVSAFPFTLFATGRLKSLEKVSLKYRKMVPEDPYYQTISQVSFLYGFAYSGNLVMTEIFARRFQSLHESGQLLRYKPISEIITLLPLALRGYASVLSNGFNSLLNLHDQSQHDPSINSQFYRIAAIICLAAGEFSRARQCIELATEYRKIANFATWEAIDNRIKDYAQKGIRIENIFSQVLGVSKIIKDEPALGSLLLSTLSGLTGLAEGNLDLETLIHKKLESYFPEDRVQLAPNLPKDWEDHVILPLSQGFISVFVAQPERKDFCLRMVEGLIPVVKILEEINQKIAKSRKLEKENAIAVAIASTTQAMAHDVRKPFSMLKMVLEAVSEAENPNESQEIAKASLPEVNQAMASVEGMIQDVMQIGSNSKPNQEVASPEAVIDAAVNELFRIFPDADVGIEYDLNHKHSLFIDTMRVGRVFSNILVNAVQAMNTKGKLWIKTKEGSGLIEFRLGNVGSCIPKESLPKLFEAFFTSGKKGGTGLGLAIAQKVVNEHGGSIRCESDKTEEYPSGYVEFIMTLPVSSELNPKREEPLPSHSSVIHEQLLKLKKKDSSVASTDELEQEKILSKRLKTISGSIPSILIVDDEAVYRNALAGLLTNFRGGESEVARIPIHFAKNAAEAMEVAERNSPFLVIQDIDLGLSAKNGIDVIRDLRKSGFKGRICVHSNRFLFDDQKAATEAGADSVLPKPMSRTHLFKLILSSLPEAGVKIVSQPSLPAEKRKPKIAYIDDAITFTLSWKFRLKDKIDLDTFPSTAAFFTKCENDRDFLQSLDVIVTDFYFGDSDPLNGKSFAAELRKSGFEKPIYLASNGDFNSEDLKPDLTGAISKDVPSFETILSWIDPITTVG